MDRKRWFVRYLILSAIGAILTLKVYLLLFVFDLTVGIYSLVTSFVLFSILLFSYTKFRDPYLEAQQEVDLNHEAPMVSIIIPVKNEENHISDCVQSCLNATYSNKEVIVVNDGSTDGTARVLDQIHKRDANPMLHIIHLSKNVGKKKAIEAATGVAKGEIYVFVDSDCEIATDSIDRLVKIFNSDRTIGALTGHGRVKNVADGNALQKIQDVWYDGQFRIIKGMESSFSSLTCCSGALSAYRRIAVQPYIHQWAHEKFLGRDFRFATDRRLTAFVLGTRVKKANTQQGAANYQLLQTGHDELETMERSFDADGDSDWPRHYWKVEYSPSVNVSIIPPATFAAFIRQQIRWRKSFIRSIFSTGEIYWKRPFSAALLYYLQVCLKIFRPFIVLKALVLLPLTGDFITGILFVTAILFTGMIYGVDFRLRNPGSTLWLYRPLMTLLSVFVLSWLLIYSALTIRRMAWR